MENNIEDIKKDFLDRIVFRWMKDDVQKMKNEQLNFPLALCTLSYMGFLGSILLGKDTYGEYEDGRKYINECFAEGVRAEYKTDTLILADVFRNPLAHEYFARGGISKTGHRPALYKVEGKIILDADSLAHDFLSSLDKFQTLIERDSEGKFYSRLVEMKTRLEKEEDKYLGSFMTEYFVGASTASSMVIAGAVKASALHSVISASTAGLVVLNEELVKKDVKK